MDEVLVSEEVQGRVIIYDAFISHRGSELKKLAEKIHGDLSGLGVSSFVDSREIRKGENLSGVIVEAIRASSIWLVLLSKGFAESPWCLDEVRMMVDERENGESKGILIPVYYNVGPDDLRDVNRGPFKKAFRMHRKSKDYSLETIAKWEEVLKQVAEIWGPTFKDYSRKEDLVSALVEDVVRRVKSVDMEVAKYPVAIDQRVNELHAIINNQESLYGACIVGIVGMTGIGKTTIAKRYFNLHRSSFRSSCFVGNMKQMTGEELQNTQKMLLKELALYNGDHISSTDQGIKLLKKHLQGAKILLVLDDVDDHLQLEALMVHEVLSHESIILVTSNNNGLVKKFHHACIYDVPFMDRDSARKLLLMHAMKRPELSHPELEEFTEEFLNLSDGLPLSLEVYGQKLSGITSRFYWENTLKKASEILPAEITKRFQSSFVNLSETEKNVVLDIACFLDGEDKDIAVSFWNSLGISSDMGLNKLTQKSIVKQEPNSERLSIHSQLKQFFLQSLNEDYMKDPSSCTRLWQEKHVQKALQQNTGFMNVEYLSLVERRSYSSKMSELNMVPSSIIWKEDGIGLLRAWPVQCFTKMSKLKLLFLEDTCIEGEFNKLPKGIIWLRWRFCPYVTLPKGLPLANLRVLELEGGQFSHLWDDQENSEVPLQLRHLQLQGCENLIAIPTSIGKLVHLKTLVLKDCKALVTLPNEICNLQSLVHLDMSGCISLENLPPLFENLRYLRILNLSGCEKLGRLPDSFVHLSCLVDLNLRNCKQLMALPFDHLAQLTYLDISGCELLDLQHPIYSRSLVFLNLLSCKSFNLLPSIVQLPYLCVLMLSSRDFIKLPCNFGQLSFLFRLDIRGPELVELPSSFGELCNLLIFTLDGCPNLKNLVPSIGQLRNLKTLVLSSCGLVELPEQIGHLCNLEVLRIKECRDLVQLPFSIGNLSKLKEMELIGNSGLYISHQCFSNLSLLGKLVLDECQVSNESFALICGSVSSLASLQLCKLSIAHVNVKGVFMNLISLSITSCPNLVEFEVSPTLRQLEIIRCPLLKIVSVPSGFSMGLRELTLRNCEGLSMIQSIDELQHLEKLDTVGCMVLHYVQGLEQVKTLKELHIFITYWGFLYYGDEWLQKLQKHIYAPAMHFATKTVFNKHEIFQEFHTMNSVSMQHLEFTMPESTVPCAWIMVAFISRNTSKDYGELLKSFGLNLEGEGSISLFLSKGAISMVPVHEYPDAETGETIHFSIFTSDFWLCEQLKSGRKIILRSESPFVTLESGWVRMLSIQEESNIEAIQREFFENLRSDKEVGFRTAQEVENDFYSTLVQKRKEARIQAQNITKAEDGLYPELQNLQLVLMSAEDMRDFQALDVANCRIIRSHSLLSLQIQAEILTPTYEKMQTLFLQDCIIGVNHLDLQISKACMDAVDIAVLYSTPMVFVQSMCRESYEDYPIKCHEFSLDGSNEPSNELYLKATEDPGVARVAKLLMSHVEDNKLGEEIQDNLEKMQLRQSLAGNLEFFADDEGGIGCNIF
ncbi:hypothetical protein AMTRI_Chr04g252550 [Amborella trichopoda]